MPGVITRLEIADSFFFFFCEAQNFFQFRSTCTSVSQSGYLTDRAHDDFRSVGKIVNASVRSCALGRYMLHAVGRYLGR